MSLIVCLVKCGTHYKTISYLHVDHINTSQCVQRVHEKQCTENVPNLCFESMQGRVMHPVSSTNVNMSLTVSRFRLLV